MDPRKNPDSLYIQSMFDRLSGRYDLFCRLTSLGQDIRWRREALNGLKPGIRMLDLGCGTGDLTSIAAGPVAENGGCISAIDFSGNMLDRARERLKKERPGFSGVQFFQKRAEDLPFESEPYDLVVSGFVLRNIYENIDGILDGVKRSLRDGGAVRFLDFTEPPNPVLCALWRGYMNTVAALWGMILFGKDYPAFYLTDSAKRFVKPPEFVKKLESAGFREIKLRFFMLGSIVLYQAVK